MIRRVKTALYILVALSIVCFFHPSTTSLGPRYVEWKEEDAIRVKEGTRMLRFDTPQGHGLVVQLQTLLLQHHISVITNRSLAYDPILLQPRHSISLFSRLLSGLSVSRPYGHLPISAFISSFSSNFESLPDINASPAIPLTAPKVRTACGKGKAGMVEFQTPYNPEGVIVPEGEGMGLVHQMQMEIGASERDCVWVKGNVLDYSFYQSPAPIDILPSLLISPVLAHYAPSRRVMEIINGALYRLDPETPLYSIDSVLTPSSPPRTPKAGTLRSLLVLHLPAPTASWRGTCDIAAEHRLPFYGFNKLLPALPGNEGVPPSESMSLPAVEGLYNKKCRPPVLDVISRARRLRKNHPLLKSVYVVTDPQVPKKEPPLPGSTSKGTKEPEAHRWSDEVKMWLESEGWEHVWVGRDDVWPGGPREKAGEGVDLEVARRAGVFVGNGFSPFASNVVLFRQRDGLHRDLTQFW